MGSSARGALSASFQQIPASFRSVWKPLKAQGERPGILPCYVNGLICVSLCGLRARLSLGAVLALIADQEGMFNVQERPGSLRHVLFWEILPGRTRSYESSRLAVQC